MVDPASVADAACGPYLVACPARAICCEEGTEACLRVAGPYRLRVLLLYGPKQWWKRCDHVRWVAIGRLRWRTWVCSPAVFCRASGGTSALRVWKLADLLKHGGKDGGKQAMDAASVACLSMHNPREEGAGGALPAYSATHGIAVDGKVGRRRRALVLGWLVLT